MAKNKSNTDRHKQEENLNAAQDLIYSGTSIYRSHNDHFPACTVCHFWSRMKFHINDVIYSHIHRSPNYRFTTLIVCKSRSPRSISRMDRLKKKKNWNEVIIICVTSLWTINLATQKCSHAFHMALSSASALLASFLNFLCCKWFCAFWCDF